MRALLLLLFTLLAGSAAAQDSVSLTGCQDDQADCRDGCTIEYGGSTRTYAKLGACLQKCKKKYDKCLERQFAVQEREKLNLAPESSPAAPAPGTGELSEEDANQAGESSGEAAESPGRRGVYRASESATEPEPEAAAPENQSKPDAKASESKEPEAIEDTTELDLLFDEAQPPSPKPKSEPPRPKPTAEPQKEDVADWETNGK